MSGAGAVNNKEVVDPTITGGTIDGSSLGATTPITIANVDNIQINGNTISSTNVNGDVNITPNGIGNVVLDGLKYPQADGIAGQVLKTDGAAQLSWVTASSGAPPIQSGYYSGKYFRGGMFAVVGATTNLIDQNIIYTRPMYVPSAANFSHVVVENAATDAAKQAKIAIYNTGANGFPGTLREYLGTVSLVAASVKEVAITTTSFVAGVYWIVIKADVGLNWRVCSANNPCFLSMDYDASTTANLNPPYYNHAYATAFPDLTATAPTGFYQYTLRTFFKVT